MPFCKECGSVFQIETGVDIICPICKLWKDRIDTFERENADLKGKLAKLREAVDKQATEWEKRAVHYSIVWSTPAESAMECIYRKCASDLRAKLEEV